MKQADIIADKIDRFRLGYIFTPSDFYDDVRSPAVVSRILSRMVKEGKIRRIAKGKFDKPAKSVLGIVPPSLDWLTRTYLFDDKRQIGYLTGTRVFAEMGLTTQISSVIEIGSNTYKRALTRNGCKIRFVLQKNTINAENIPLLQLLDAIRFIKTIPGSTVKNSLTIIRQRMSAMSSEQRKRLSQLTLNYAPCTRAIAGAILDELGDDVTSLQSTLNPVSKYNLGITTSDLPTSKNWNII